ncbi:MAG: hypothetical protein JW751_09210 [Polyangiaceae bacterium]|nr:hypothetical protein [Polyangiaceae bacterium]
MRCSEDEYCNRSTGICTPAAEGCRDLEPDETFCTDDVLVRCGPDLVTSERTTCEGLCAVSNGTADCVTPACGDGKWNGEEQCDDGNLDGGDACAPDCTFEPVAIALGNYHSCAIGANGVVKCWGQGNYGQLGLGDTEHRGNDPDEMGDGLPAVDLGPGRTAQALAVGEHHTCALLDNSGVRCWGENEFGQLGLGDTERRGDEPGEMGSALPYVSLGTGRTAIAIAAGADATCALLDDDSLKCWGLNDQAQLGLGDSRDRSSAQEFGDALPPVDLRF